jgi:oligopeptidase A
VKAYFIEPKVVAGLFKVIESLFTVKVKPDSGAGLARGRALLPHRDTGRRAGRPVLHGPLRPRNQARRRLDGRSPLAPRTAGGIQKPIAYLNCNFARPVGGKPATFTHDEVITLFHETGHGLHHLLTRGEELGVSGIHGVEWDAVELPSQFMENYCWEWEVCKA